MREEKSFIKSASNVRSWASLLTWLYDLVASNWTLIIGFLVSSGILGSLAVVTEWASEAGPLGVGLIAIFGGLLVNLMIAFAQRQRAAVREKTLFIEITRERARSADAINPLDGEFNRKRIKIDMLANPVSQTISRKRFIDCQLIGPVNILLLGNGTIAKVLFANCDFIVVKDNVHIFNAIIFEDVEVLGGEIQNASIYMSKDIAQRYFTSTNFITLTGDADLDQRPFAIPRKPSPTGK